MDMLSALRLCRDTGARVRPVAWRLGPFPGQRWPGDSYVRCVRVWRHERFVESRLSDPGRDALVELRWAEEWLGEWEVVE